jgi:hypothetical protein
MVMRTFSEHRPEARMQWRFERLEKMGIVVRRSGVGAIVGHAAMAAKRRREVRQWRLARFSRSRRTIVANGRCIREENRSVLRLPRAVWRFSFDRCFEFAGAQQGARANVHIGHASCYRTSFRNEAANRAPNRGTSRARCGRGSSLTFGKKKTLSP